MRWVFISGPGDVVGTYTYWKKGQHDPRVPVHTYSHMLYNLAQERNAELQVIHAHVDQVTLDDGPFQFRSQYHGNPKGRFAYFTSQLSIAMQLVKQVRQLDPDVLLVSAYSPLIALPFFPNRARVFMTMHNTLWPMNNPPKPNWRIRLRTLVRKWTLRRLDGAVCTSLECKRQLQTTVGDTVPLYVERPVISGEIALRPRAEKPSNIIYVGRVEHNKGIFMLLDAFDKLAKDDPDLTLTFVGDGGALRELEERAKSSQHSNRIKVLGRLLAAQVHEQLAVSDLLVCPTMTGFKEGLALVGLEAASHGVPSIVSTVVPAQDILGDACAVFQTDDTAHLTQVLNERLTSKDKYTKMVAAAENLSATLQNPSQSWGVQLATLIDSKHT